jgi:hypothetical protein
VGRFAVKKHPFHDWRRREALCYSKVSGFWSSLLRCFHVSGKWPKVLEI